MRELDEFEAESVLHIRNLGIPYARLELTRTMLGKGIADATDEIRTWLLEAGLHDYEGQSQGDQAKIVRFANVVGSDSQIRATKASFYRPVTKSGDPRLWFYGLGQRTQAGHIMLLFAHDGLIWAVDISENRLEDLARQHPDLRKALRPAIDSPEAVVTELVDRLKELRSRGFIRVQRAGTTGVGHLLETLLGITANSNKAPDYKGVELKSTRAVASASQTLFAQVADWSISPLKSSKRILEEFGYNRYPEMDSGLRLYCSVKADVPNSQGLYFHVNDDERTLDELSTKISVPVVARWRLGDLEDRLAEKHRHTIWVNASQRGHGADEEVRFDVATYRSAPIVEQFAPMIASREIHMDHLIKKSAGRVVEKGPLFKIAVTAFGKMFADPRVFDLASN